ncbi:MAG: hypothetical protein N3F67_01235 [Acidilobaceae archaeon]|nr:hypothetical protein [Acidilobaceae archaeon]
MFSLSFLASLVRKLRAALRSIDAAVKEESVHALEQELRELEAAFLMLSLGSFVGVRSMTPFLSLEILEALQEEVKLLRERAYKGEDVIGEVAAALGGGT